MRDGVAEQLDAAGLDVWVTGPAGFIADLVVAFGGIDTVLLLVALVAVLLILAVVYRSPILPFIVIITAVFALSLAGLLVYYLADAGVLVLNGQAQGILSILVVGAAVDYSLLVVARYREELKHVLSPSTAMRRALRACFEPILASAGTVIAGLLCLLLSDLASNRSLGPVAAIGIASAFLAALTFLPALLLVGGKRSRGVFWPIKPTFVDGAADGAADTSATVATTGLWARVAGFVARHDRPVWIITALVLAAAAAFVPTLDASGTGDGDVFLTQVDSVDGEEVLVEHFPGASIQPTIIIAPEAQADEVLAAAEGVEGVESAALVAESTSDGRPGATDAGPPVVVDGSVRIDVVTTDPADTQGAVATVTNLREAVHATSSEAIVGGAAAERLDTQAAGTRDLQVIVPVVLVVVLLILMLLLRSVLAAVLLMAANVLSFGAALGVSALLFNHVFGFPGADPTVPLYAFCFLVALGVDYTIFLMTRVREETVKHGTRLGVTRGLTVTGSVITSAGIVLAATFAALGIIPLLFLAQLAFIVSFGCCSTRSSSGRSSSRRSSTTSVRWCGGRPSWRAKTLQALSLPWRLVWTDDTAPHSRPCRFLDLWGRSPRRLWAPRGPGRVRRVGPRDPRPSRSRGGRASDRHRGALARARRPGRKGLAGCCRPRGSGLARGCPGPLRPHGRREPVAPPRRPRRTSPRRRDPGARRQASGARRGQRTGSGGPCREHRDPVHGVPEPTVGPGAADAPRSPARR